VAFDPTDIGDLIEIVTGNFQQGAEALSNVLYEALVKAGAGAIHPIVGGITVAVLVGGKVVTYADKVFSNSVVDISDLRDWMIANSLLPDPNKPLFGFAIIDGGKVNFQLVNPGGGLDPEFRWIADP